MWKTCRNRFNEWVHQLKFLCISAHISLPRKLPWCMYSISNDIVCWEPEGCYLKCFYADLTPFLFQTDNMVSISVTINISVRVCIALYSKCGLISNLWIVSLPSHENLAPFIKAFLFAQRFCMQWVDITWADIFWLEVLPVMVWGEI